MHFCGPWRVIACGAKYISALVGNPTQPGVSMDVLVDDDLDLPQQLPPVQTSDWVMKEGKPRYGKAR